MHGLRRRCVAGSKEIPFWPLPTAEAWLLVVIGPVLMLAGLGVLYFPIALAWSFRFGWVAKRRRFRVRFPHLALAVMLLTAGPLTWIVFRSYQGMTQQFWSGRTFEIIALAVFAFVAVVAIAGLVFSSGVTAGGWAFSRWRARGRF